MELCIVIFHVIFNIKRLPQLYSKYQSDNSCKCIYFFCSYCIPICDKQIKLDFYCKCVMAIENFDTVNKANQSISNQL